MKQLKFLIEKKNEHQDKDYVHEFVMKKLNDLINFKTFIKNLEFTLNLL